jgi:hypothetical protein
MIFIFLLNLYAKLFLFFINDIADDIQSLVRLFVDDSSLIFSSTNPLEVEDRLNLDLHFSIKPLCQRRSNALEISQKSATVI